MCAWSQKNNMAHTPHTKHHTIRPHLSAEELARRQRWVAVGVGIIALLMVSLWISTLPGRVRTLGGNGVSGIIGQTEQHGSYIDIDKMIGN